MGKKRENFVIFLSFINSLLTYSYRASHLNTPPCFINFIQEISYALLKGSKKHMQKDLPCLDKSKYASILFILLPYEVNHFNKLIIVPY
jgi:hypothetical protein